MIDIGPALGRVKRILRLVDQLGRVDMLILLLATVATLAIAMQLRLNTVASWQRETSGSSSPLEFKRKLLTPSLTGGHWVLLIAAAPASMTCRDVHANHPDLVPAMVILETMGSPGSPARCVAGERSPIPPQLRHNWAMAFAAVKHAGASLALLDASGAIVYSSRDRAIPAGALQTLRQAQRPDREHSGTLR